MRCSTVSRQSFDPDALTRAEQEQRFGQNNDMLALFPADYAFPPPRDRIADDPVRQSTNTPIASS